MSETNNQIPEELIEEVGYTVEDAEVIPSPIDPTLSHAGEAADAKATGDAIKAVAVIVNGKSRDTSTGAITVYASDIPISGEEGAQTIDEAIDGANSRTGAEIALDGSEDSLTIAEAYQGAAQYVEQLDTRLTEVEQSATDEMTAEEVDTIYDTIMEGEN